MDTPRVFQYYKALKAIRANQQKSAIETAVFPHLSKQKSRDDVQRSLSNAVRHNVSDGDFAKEKELEDILRERRSGQRTD